MSAAEAIQYSPLQISAGEIVMAVEKTGGISGSSVQENQGSGSAKNFVVSTASPTLKQGSGKLAGLLTTLRLQNRETDALNAEILSSLVEMQSQLQDSDLSSLNKDQFVQDLKEKLTGLESVLGGNVPGIRKMKEALDNALATSSEESEGSQNSFQGTTTAEARKNIALAAMSSVGAQSSVAEVLQAMMKESSVTSEKTLGMIEATRVLQDQNWDDWAAQQKKQDKMHFWTKVGMIAASAIVVAAVGLFVSPVAAAVLAGLIVMQMSGATDKMFSQINNPALKALAETAFVVGVAVASGGVAGLAEGISEVGLSGVVELATGEGGTLSEDVAEKTVQQMTNAAKSTAFMAGSTGLMTSDLIAMTAQGLTNLFYLGHEQAASKKYVELGLQTILTIAVVCATVGGAMKMGGGVDQLSTLGKGLMALGSAVQLGTDGLMTYSSEQLLKMAKDQNLNALFTANLQEAQTLNQTNMSWSKSSQEQVRNMLESMQNSLLSTLQQLCQPIVAAAEAVRRA